MSRNKKKQTRLVVGISIVAVTIIAISWLQLSSNLVYFYTPEEAFAKGTELKDKLIRVGGMVKEGTVLKNTKDITLDFTLTDFNGHDFNIHYSGTAPDLFKENQGVVVEGRMLFEEKKIIAQKLMVKHSEEYRKPDDPASMDKELLQESLFKDQ